MELLPATWGDLSPLALLLNRAGAEMRDASKCRCMRRDSAFSELRPSFEAAAPVRFQVWLALFLGTGLRKSLRRDAPDLPGGGPGTGMRGARCRLPRSDSMNINTIDTINTTNDNNNNTTIY